jgi:hypothetical protein
MNRRRALVVAYHFPPDAAIGTMRDASRRPAADSRELGCHRAGRPLEHIPGRDADRSRSVRPGAVYGPPRVSPGNPSVSKRRKRP